MPLRRLQGVGVTAPPSKQRCRKLPAVPENAFACGQVTAELKDRCRVRSVHRSCATMSPRSIVGCGLHLLRLLVSHAEVTQSSVDGALGDAEVERLRAMLDSVHR